MNKLSSVSLAWMFLSAACISLDDVPLKPTDALDGATGVTPTGDAGSDVYAPIVDGGSDGQSPGLDSGRHIDAQAPGEPLLADGGTPACNADSFCLISSFRPRSSLEADGDHVYVLEPQSTDVLGNLRKDGRIWKVESAAKSMIVTGLDAGDFAELTGAGAGFVYWSDGGGPTYRAPVAGGLPQLVCPSYGYASGELLWCASDSLLELRSSNGQELHFSSARSEAAGVGTACGELFYEREIVDTGYYRISMRTRSNPAVAVELGLEPPLRRMFCDAGHVFLAHIQFGQEGFVSRIDAQTKQKLTVALGFKHALRQQWLYSLRLHDLASPQNLDPTRGPMSVERWSTETPGESLKLGVVDDVQAIAATSSAVYVLDAAGNLFRKSVPQ